MDKKLEKIGSFAGIEETGFLLLLWMESAWRRRTRLTRWRRLILLTLDMLWAKYPHVKLKAHGTAVGLPSDDDMGNSEVGHNALGAGQVFAQGAKLVSQSIESGKMFASSTWQELIANVKKNESVLHFLGLFSDGNVHSHIDHLKAMIVEAKKEGVKKVRVHVLIDGRDVGETLGA